MSGCPTFGTVSSCLKWDRFNYLKPLWFLLSKAPCDFSKISVPHQISVPHPCAFFPAQGWETTILNSADPYFSAYGSGAGFALSTHAV